MFKIHNQKSRDAMATKNRHKYGQVSSWMNDTKTSRKRKQRQVEKNKILLIHKNVRLSKMHNQRSTVNTTKNHQKYG